VFRAGEQGRYWYAVLGGSLEVRYHGTEAAANKVNMYFISHVFTDKNERTSDVRSGFRKIFDLCPSANIIFPTRCTTNKAVSATSKQGNERFIIEPGK
jgi:hypothetical protein